MSTLASTEYRKLAGYITQRRNKITGAIVVVYDAKEQQLDTTAGKYAIVCEKHNTIHYMSNRRSAIIAAQWNYWCDDCESEVSEATNG